MLFPDGGSVMSNIRQLMDKHWLLVEAVHQCSDLHSCKVAGTLFLLLVHTIVSIYNMLDGVLFDKADENHLGTGLSVLWILFHVNLMVMIVQPATELVQEARQNLIDFICFHFCFNQN